MLTLERLKKFLHYGPDTGALTWLATKSAIRVAGSIAGNMDSYGYIIIGFDGCKYKAHRLAWFYMTGEWPEKTIDHINENKSDNRWRNLRQADLHQQQHNRAAPRTNSSGFKGVVWHKKYSRWQAQIRTGGKRLYLGMYNTPEEAAEAYNKAAEKAHGEFANYNCARAK